MSSPSAPARSMTETSVIKHYKKQLIYRQHDVPEPGDKGPHFLDEVSGARIYDLVHRSDATPNGRKVRRKRKNRNCRGQFRHEGMELIKLGTTPSHTLCKSKEPISRLVDKPPPPDPRQDDRSVPQSAPSPQATVIHAPFATKTILESPHAPHFGHALPQMVPERRPRKPEPEPRPPTPPPHRPAPPAYRPYLGPPPYPHPGAFRPALPPPPYPVARSPPRPVPRVPVRPAPVQKGSPYAGIRFPFSRLEFELQEHKRRRHEDKAAAAIDLTVDGKGAASHRCHCECGKMYTNDPVTQEMIVTVSDRDSSQVPSYIRGKMANGAPKMDRENKQNGAAKATTPVITKGRPSGEGKVAPQFLIADLLAKTHKPPDAKARHEDIPVPIRTEPNRVIVSTKGFEEPIPRPKSKDHTVSNIIGDNRRQSVEIDTISISSSGSESVRSPRPKSIGLDKQVPHGKLFYYKSNHSFIRYFDDTQKKLFIDSITSDGAFDKTLEDKEVIQLPKTANFSFKDNLTVEEYVSEMTLVETFIPRDFFLFYKFVTGYQICNHNLPVSFLTFLKVYNTNGLKILLERYISSLKQN